MANDRQAQIAADAALARSLQEAENRESPFANFLDVVYPGAAHPPYPPGGLDDNSPPNNYRSRLNAQPHQETQRHRSHQVDEHGNTFYYENHVTTSATPGRGESQEMRTRRSSHVDGPGDWHMMENLEQLPGHLFGLANALGGSSNLRPSNTTTRPSQGMPSEMGDRRQRLGPRDRAAQQRADAAMRRQQDRPRPGSYGPRNTDPRNARGPGGEEVGGSHEQRRAPVGMQEPIGYHSLFGEVFGPGDGHAGMGGYDGRPDMFGRMPDQGGRTQGGGRASQGPASRASQDRFPGPYPVRYPDPERVQRPPEFMDLLDGVLTNMLGGQIDIPDENGLPFGNDGPGTNAGRLGPGRGSPLGPMLSRFFRSAGIFDGQGALPRSYEEWLQFGENMGTVNRGATDEQIAGLETETIGSRGASRRPGATVSGREAASSSSGSQSGLDEPGEKCAICLGEYEEGTVIKRLPCGHVFCDECISQWLRINKECPCCKASILESGPS